MKNIFCPTDFSACASYAVEAAIELAEHFNATLHLYSKIDIRYDWSNLSDEQRAKMRGVTVEQLQQMEASESLQKAFSKFAEPLAKMLTALTPIVNAFASIVSFVRLHGFPRPVPLAFWQIPICLLGPVCNKFYDTYHHARQPCRQHACTRAYSRSNLRP